MSPAPKSAEILKQVGDEFRLARQRKGISLRKFSETLNLSPSYYSKVERGEVVAGPKTYMAICHSLGIAHEGILEKVGKVDPEIEAIITERQADASGLFRTLHHLPPEAIVELTQKAKELEQKHRGSKKG